VKNRRDVLASMVGAGAALFAGTPAAARPRSLIQRRIPSSGEEVPAVGLGTWQTFDVGGGEAERAPLREVLRRFVAEGGRVIDSSPMYGRSEAVVGELAASLGVADRLFVATKVWTRGRAQGIAQMQASMRLLRAPRLDLMQVHNLLDVDTHLATLADWKAAGRVRYVGVTHYTVSAYDALAGVLERHAVDFVQLNYSLLTRDAERRLLPLARDRGIAVLVNRPFEGGDAFREVRRRPLPAFAAELECRSWAQLFLKYILSHPAVTCAIPATSNPEHLSDNMGGGRGPLPDDALRQRLVRAVGGAG
jgi:aryl-alcohol dehydrogenase-like predicted oxidoreductase